MWKFENWYRVKCQLSDYVFLWRVPRRTIIAKTSNLHQKVGYRQAISGSWCTIDADDWIEFFLLTVGIDAVNKGCPGYSR